MSLPLQTVEDASSQQNFDAIALRFPLGSADLQLEAATKVHTTTAMTSGPTSTSTADPMTAVIPQMTITEDFGGNTILALFVATVVHDTATASVQTELYDAGTAVANSRRQWQALANNAFRGHGELCDGTPAAGSRTIDVRWRTTTGTMTSTTTQRQLTILELRR